MITKDVTIEIASGTDARETAMLVQIANRYKSSLYLKSKEKTFNAKSIMGMMTLGLKSGDTLSVTADGEDEEEAINSITDFLIGKKS